ncbi:MAG: 30S ribosomal protein S1, partial [Micrococcus sp.]|nr:30S ribosomal protein S1 [Micrococcus sp.]
RHLSEAEEAAASGPAEAPSGSASYSSEDEETPVEDAGTLASDEALAALREKLTGN